jgi:hypothetical protein
VFRIEKVSNYGTSTPAVARTFYRGCEILEFFTDASKDKREQAKTPLWELLGISAGASRFVDSAT